MKKISYLLLAIVLSSCALRPALRGTFTDARDGHKYTWVKLGTQTWMSQNLDYECGNSWYYNDDSTHHKTYGRYYNGKTALVVCPAGWHLPSDEEWKTLEVAVGMLRAEANSDFYRGYVAKSFMKRGSTEMNVLFLGYLRLGNRAAYFDEKAFFWTSTTKNNATYYTRTFTRGANSIMRDFLGSNMGCNVRCVKDEK